MAPSPPCIISSVLSVDASSAVSAVSALSVASVSAVSATVEVSASAAASVVTAADVVSAVLVSELEPHAVTASTSGRTPAIAFHFFIFLFPFFFMPGDLRILPVASVIKQRKIIRKKRVFD
jgi:hypothetical protein